jgi:hypothetical protein
MSIKTDVAAFDSAELRRTVGQWRAGLVDNIAVADLYDRCPIAHKWKAPYRCLVVREALLRRMVDLGEAIIALTEGDHALAVRTLTRAALETTALLEYMAQRIDAVVTRDMSWWEFEPLTMRLLMGSRNGGNFEAVNILTALRAANRRYGALELIHTKLSESVHPNYDGVVYGYSRGIPSDMETRFGNYWQENFGHEQDPALGYVFPAFADAYNNHWIDAMEHLEQWLRDNNEQLERERHELDASS